MSNTFNTVFYKKPKRNKFNLSHDRKMSLEMGRLYPIFCQEVLPSDKFVMSSEILLRMAPMVAPIMHRINVYTHFFFVPNRIVWNGWEEFITGGEDGNANPEFPYANFGATLNGTVVDYMGVQAVNQIVPTGKVNALPFFAFNKIWNEYYRDQNLQAEVVDEAVDGDNTTALASTAGVKPPRRAWRHDYFTSALPFAQKGQAVSIPIGDTASLVFDRDWGDNPVGNMSKLRMTDESNIPTPDALSLPNTKMSTIGGQFNTLENNRSDTYSVDVTDHTYVDLSSATSNTINDLRRAFRLQEWLEKNARGGSRYVELLQVHFGVKSQDSRLQRPEYLGGGRSPISVSEVLQTSSPQNEDDTPQGNLAGHGIGLSKSHQFSRYIQEHGFIIGIMSVMPEPAYQQGLHRQWSKFDRFDYFWQEFAHIGEQEILSKELYNNPNESENEEVFGYTPRYSEYRYIPSTVHGDFKDTLNYWHMSRVFNNRPYLNKQFIECAPTDRIFAVQNIPDDGSGEPTPVREWDTVYAHVYHKITAIRPIPKFGIPSF